MLHGFLEQLINHRYHRDNQHHTRYAGHRAPQEYAAQAYMRCCRVAALFLREKEKRK